MAQESVVVVDNAVQRIGNPCDFEMELSHQADVRHVSVGRVRMHQTLPSFNDSCNTSTLRLWDDTQAFTPTNQHLESVSLNTNVHYPDPASMCTQAVPPNPSGTEGINQQWASSATALMHLVHLTFSTTSGRLTLAQSGAPGSGVINFTIPAEEDSDWNSAIGDFWLKMGFTKQQWGLKPFGGSGINMASRGYATSIEALLPPVVELTRNVYVELDIMGPSNLSTVEDVESRNILFSVPLPAYDVIEDTYLYDRRAMETARTDFDSIKVRLLDDRLGPMTSDGTRLRSYFELRLYNT